MNKTWPLLIIFAIIMMAQYASADKIICDYCKEEIKTQYIESDGKYYHPIHFKCAGCGTVIGHVKNYIQNGKHYCKDCYFRKFGKTCAYCGKVIMDKYIIKDGKEYHKSCFNESVLISSLQ